MKMTIFVTLGMIAVLSVGYISTVGVVWAVFYLIHIMTGTVITWNVWIAGLIGYIIFLMIK